MRFSPAYLPTCTYLPTYKPTYIHIEEEEAAVLLTEDNDKALSLLADFLEGDKDYRNARFKLIPSVVEGSYIIRYSVGNKPVLLGKKLTQRYWEGPGYLEVCMCVCR